MTPDEQAQLEKIFEKHFGTLADTIKTATGAINKKQASQNLSASEIKALREQVRASTDNLKRSQPAYQKFADVLKGSSQKFIDVTDSIEMLDTAIKQTIDDEKNSNRLHEAAELKKQRRDLESAAVARVAQTAVQNFGVGSVRVAGMLSRGAADFTKDLLSNRGGIETATDLAANAAKLTGNTIGEFGEAVGMAGTALAFLPGIVGKIAKLLVFLGPAVGLLGKTAGSFAAEAVTALGQELVKTQKSFHDITGMGVELAGGMGELRNQAARAGLTVDQLGAVAKAAGSELSNMGIGLGEATKRIAGISHVLRSSDLGTQLQNLGYSFEEQAELGASVAANLAAAGKLRTSSDAAIAAQTAQYGKDLKVLAAVTGEDAKKKLEEARTRAMEADVLAATMAQGGQDAVLKLQAQLASMPDSLKKGYLEFVSTGGSAIADAATNVAITENPKIMDQYRQQLASLSDSSKDQSAALNETLMLTEQTGKYAQENLDLVQAVGMAARFGAQGIAGGAAEINNALIMSGVKIQEGSTKAALAATEAAAKTMDPLTKSVNELDKNAQQMKVALGDQLTGPLTKFADTLRAGIGTVEDALRKLGLDTKDNIKATGSHANENFGGMAGGAAGAIVGGAFGAGLGSVVGPIGTIVGGTVGATVLGWLGEKGGSLIGSYFDSGQGQDIPSKALGGVVSGPSSGFKAMLHGIEAVVPLPDGKTIPVMLNMPDSDLARRDTVPPTPAALNTPKLDLARRDTAIPKTLIADLGSALSRNITNPVNTGNLPNLDQWSEKLGNLLDDLADKVQPVTQSAVASDQSSNSSAITNALRDLIDLTEDQLAQLKEAVDQLRDHKDLTRKLLSATV